MKKKYKNRGPKLPKECKKCQYYNPYSEAYACDFCHLTIERDKKLEEKDCT